MDATQPGAALDEHSAVAALAKLRENAPPEDEETEVEPAEETEVEEPAEEPAETEEGEEPESEEEAEEESEPEPESEGPADLEAVAKHLGLPVSDLVLKEDGTVAIKTKVNGEDGEVALSELRKGYQLESSYTRKAMELADERKSFETARQAEISAITAERQRAQEVLNVATQFLQGQYANVDWQALKQNDFQQYQVLKDQYEEHVRGVEALHAAMQQGQAQQSQAYLQQQQAWIQAQAKELVNHIPEWKDPKVAEKGLGELRKGAQESYQLAPEEFDSVSDARHIRILRDALAYRALQNKKATVMKSVKKAPNLAKPGSGQKQTTNSTQQLRERFGQSHSEHDAAALLAALRRKG